MQPSIDELYERIGRHLRPKIQGGIVLDNRGGVKYRIRNGQCARTGLAGPVVDYEKSMHGTVIVPTLTKLLWMFSEQAIPKTDGTPCQQRIGGTKNRVIVLTDKSIITNVPFDAKIPRLKVLAIEDILRLIAAGMQDYLFLAFGKNADATLGNNLRRSFDTLELNGELEFGKYFTVSNTSLSLQTAQTLLRSGIDMDTLGRIYRLVILNAHEPWQRERLAALTKPLNAKQRAILPVLRRAEWRDLTCARILQQQ